MPDRINSTKVTGKGKKLSKSRTYQARSTAKAITRKGKKGSLLKMEF